MRASFKTIDIAGTVGMLMSGFNERDHGNEGIHDPVQVNAMVIESAGEAFALASCDCIGVQLGSVKEIRQVVSDATGIQPENILISATHTHSSYQATRYGATDFMADTTEKREIDRVYYELFKAKVAGAIIWAYETLEEAHIGYDRSFLEGLGTNRNDPNGYHDQSVNILKAERPDGSLIGVLVNYSCHPTVLGWQNYLISSDYPGYARKLVQQAFPGSTCIFLQGSSGGASTRFTRRGSGGFAEAERLGYLLGAETIKNVCNSFAESADKPIQAQTGDLVLQVKDFGTDEFLLKQIEDETNHLRQLEADQADPKLIRKQYVTLQGAERTYQMKKNIQADHATSEMQVIRFGDINFVAIPGEPFAEIARDIKAQLGEKTFIAGYANDTLGYLVSKEGLLTDGYEKFMTAFDASTHDRIVETAVKLYQDQN